MKRFKRTIRREKKKNEEIQKSIPLDIRFEKMKISSESDHIHVPHDLILEILSRLPAKSIGRFRSVCKLWHSITTTPYFIKSFMMSARPQSLLLTFQSIRTPSRWELCTGLALSFKSNVPCQLVYSFPQGPSSSSSSYNSYQMTNDEWKRPISESVHGLVLLPGFVIWNPTMRQFLALPKPTHTRGMTYLGYDPLEGQHKVVHLTQNEQPQVLTWRTHESWRVITDAILPLQYLYGYCGARCLNGVVYFNIYNFIVSFDVRSEKFNWIKHHEYDVQRELDPLMILYEGRLALVEPINYIGGDKVPIDLYILGDEDGDIWTRKSFYLPCNGEDKTEFRTRLVFHGVTDAGELVFTSWYASSFHILYFDPRRDTVRDSLFKGIDHCVRLGDIFLNHIESLLSLHAL